MIQTEVLFVRHWVREQVASERYILKNTKSVVSGFVKTEVLLVGHWVWERVVSKWCILKNTLEYRICIDTDWSIIDCTLCSRASCIWMINTL